MQKYIKTKKNNRKHAIFKREKKRFLSIPITFNNPLKACFFNKKYPITIQIRPTQIIKYIFY